MQVSKNSDGKSDSSESRKHKSVSQFQNLVHLTRQDEKTPPLKTWWRKTSAHFSRPVHHVAERRCLIDIIAEKEWRQIR